MSTPTVLKRIIARKYEEIEERREIVSLESLQEQVKACSPCRGFVQSMEAKLAAGKSAVIAEIKKASPSKGVIRDPFIPVDIALSYQESGAACLSILTDVDFFQGADDYLVAVRHAVDLPIIRKDFMVDEYQVYESRLLGADCILLIAAALDITTLERLNSLAHDLGMDVLIEVHNEAELLSILHLPNRLVGINNRNLHDFSTRLETTYSLLDKIGKERIVVTESGIHSLADVASMRDKGVDSFLVGEAFMRSEDPGVQLSMMFGDAT